MPVFLVTEVSVAKFLVALALVLLLAVEVLVEVGQKYRGKTTISLSNLKMLPIKIINLNYNYKRSY
jgi:hypothetical protein